MPTAVVPIVMVVDTVVMPVAVPVVTTVQTPTWTRKSWVNIPIGSIRKPVANVVTDVDAIANIDVRVVADTWTISANARSVHDVVIVVA